MINPSEPPTLLQLLQNLSRETLETSRQLEPVSGRQFSYKYTFDPLRATVRFGVYVQRQIEASRNTMTNKNTLAFFSKRGLWWWFLFIASCSLVSAFPLRESREAVDLLEAVQQDVCNARASLPNLYQVFHEDYASASRNGTPAAGPFTCE